MSNKTYLAIESIILLTQLSFSINFLFKKIFKNQLFEKFIWEMNLQYLLHD